MTNRTIALALLFPSLRGDSETLSSDARIGIAIHKCCSILNAMKVIELSVI